MSNGQDGSPFSPRSQDGSPWSPRSASQAQLPNEPNLRLLALLEASTKREEASRRRLDELYEQLIHLQQQHAKEMEAKDQLLTTAIASFSSPPARAPAPQLPPPDSSSPPRPPRPSSSPSSQEVHITPPRAHSPVLSAPVFHHPKTEAVSPLEPTLAPLPAKVDEDDNEEEEATSEAAAAGEIKYSEPLHSPAAHNGPLLIHPAPEEEPSTTAAPTPADGGALAPSITGPSPASPSSGVLEAMADELRRAAALDDARKAAVPAVKEAATQPFRVLQSWQELVAVAPSLIVHVLAVEALHAFLVLISDDGYHLASPLVAMYEVAFQTHQWYFPLLVALFLPSFVLFTSSLRSLLTRRGEPASVVSLHSASYPAASSHLVFGVVHLTSVFLYWHHVHGYGSLTHLAPILPLGALYWGQDALLYGLARVGSPAGRLQALLSLLLAAAAFAYTAFDSQLSFGWGRWGPLGRPVVIVALLLAAFVRSLVGAREVIQGLGGELGWTRRWLSALVWAVYVPVACAGVLVPAVVSLVDAAWPVVMGVRRTAGLGGSREAAGKADPAAPAATGATPTPGGEAAPVRSKGPHGQGRPGDHGRRGMAGGPDAGKVPRSSAGRQPAQPPVG